MLSLSFFSLVFVVILVFVVLWVIKALIPKAKKHVKGEFGEDMELDVRLPYKRFKQLYPYSRLTYEEYKELQKRTAFKRAISSKENKRMVR